MRFSAIVDQASELLQQKGRVTYRALKLEFALTDEQVEALKEELIEARAVARDKDGKMLEWKGAAADQETETRRNAEAEPRYAPSSADAQTERHNDSRRAEAERRQLTVMFCDVVGSTVLSTQLDPEEYREVMQQYQESCTAVIRRYEGYIAQHLGDGLLVYFGYPVAHEDDARRAVRTGLEIIAALRESPLQHRPLPHPLQVRVGIHTGLVVIGEIGSSEKREILALGEAPNIAARVQGTAQPNEVRISAATYRLVEGLFTCEDHGQPSLKGVATPLTLYRVIKEGDAHSRFEVAVGTGLTPLVGREEELGLLQRRWTQAKGGAGQVVLLSGEAGIGKSRLVQTLKEQAVTEGITRIEFRCSPYHQNSAFYPIIEHLQRLLQFQREDAPATKLEKLQHTLSHYRFPQADTLRLLTALLSLPYPEGVPPLTLSPQKQKQKTHEALVAWLMEEAEKTAVYCAWEDLHWADPSTREVLTLFLEQIPTTRMFTLLTFRPEFTPPWNSRSYFTQLTLTRLGRAQVEAMVENVTGGKSLPVEVLQQIVAKTDGVPLFVEELTKSVLESVGAHGRAPLQALAIPATLQDSLMARLDRLGPAKEIAQLGATIGREFNYEVLQTVSSLDEETLQHRLKQLVDAELVYQRGLAPHAHYLFKHALIQDTAYQSLLKSMRQHYHSQIAQVLKEQFPATAEAQPELLAHHYTEASLIEQAIPYWQQAGQKAIERSANVEAIAHLTKGLELLKTLSDTPERAQRELTLQLAMGTPLILTKHAAPEVETTYTRARELCRQIGETPQLFPALLGLRRFYFVRGQLRTAHELGEQLLRLAQGEKDPDLLAWAHVMLGEVLLCLGEFVTAREHLEQGMAFYESRQHHSHAFLYGNDAGVGCLSRVAQALWFLGYPDQALKRGHEAVVLAQELSHPFSLAFALILGGWLYQYRREGQAAQERAEAAIALAGEQGFPALLAPGTILRNWALATQGWREEGIEQMRRGLASSQGPGRGLTRPYHLAMLAEAYVGRGQVEEGLTVLAEALTLVEKNEERIYEAELYRLKGALLLAQEIKSQKSKSKSQKSENTNPHPLPPDSQAETCFHKAIEIARHQQAKSLELRATTSLARLWQSQAKQDEAHKLLSEVYTWFTEGFDTADLKEAKALLEELA